MRKVDALAAALGALALTAAHAGADPRIREVAFEDRSVVTLPAARGVTTLVQFADGEHVKSVGAGQGADCTQVQHFWCVSWPANAGFLYVRPKARVKSALSLAVVTDRHLYSLLFEPQPVSKLHTAVHRLVFTYPDASADFASTQEASTRSPPPAALPLVSPPELVARRLGAQPVPVNSSYSIAIGKSSEALAPSAVFDDGRFTYLRWPGNREIPAVFEIRKDGSEMVANTRMQGDLLVVDRIALVLMLRAGSAVASVRNDAFDPQGIAPVDGTTVTGVQRVVKE